MNATRSASCSMAPDSRKSASWGRWSVRFSGARDNCDSATIGTFNSFASAFSSREICETSCWRDSKRLVVNFLDQFQQARIASEEMLADVGAGFHGEFLVFAIHDLAHALDQQTF